MSMEEPGRAPKKSGGVAPTIVTAWPLMVKVFSDVVVSAPKCLRQNSCDTTAAGDEDGESSLARSNRPTLGETPSPSKKLPETACRCADSALPLSPTFTLESL